MLNIYKHFKDKTEFELVKEIQNILDAVIYIIDTYDIENDNNLLSEFIKLVVNMKTVLIALQFKTLNSEHVNPTRYEEKNSFLMYFVDTLLQKKDIKINISIILQKYIQNNLQFNNEQIVKILNKEQEDCSCEKLEGQNK